MDISGPFEETVVNAVLRSADNEREVLLRLIQTTTVEYNHSAIITAIEKRNPLTAGGRQFLAGRVVQKLRRAEKLAVEKAEKA